MGDLAELRDEVDFYVLYVREAHPGFNVPEHKSIDGKRAQAQRVIDEEREERTVIVDDVVGTAHHVLGLAPNSVRIVDTSGLIRYTAAWADPAELKRALDFLLVGEGPQPDSHEFPQADLSTAWRVLRRAGWRAVSDFFLMIPAMRRSHKVAPLRPDT
jgi:hypothetical protein